MQTLNKDSYADRRLLFKNIWETKAVPKAKVIRTARLESNVKERKKERDQHYKHLKNICKTLVTNKNLQDKNDSLSISMVDTKKKIKRSRTKKRKWSSRSRYGTSRKKSRKQDNDSDSNQSDFDNILFENNLFSKLYAKTVKANSISKKLPQFDFALDYDDCYEKKRKDGSKGYDYINLNKSSLTQNRSKSATRKSMTIHHINITFPQPDLEINQK